MTPGAALQRYGRHVIGCQKYEWGDWAKRPDAVCDPEKCGLDATLARFDRAVEMKIGVARETGKYAWMEWYPDDPQALPDVLDGEEITVLVLPAGPGEGEGTT
jgi:hypothetical protein